MSGVIDDNGIQWERCNHCGEFEMLNHLHFAPSPKWDGNVDLCRKCFRQLHTCEPVHYNLHLLYEWSIECRNYFADRARRHVPNRKMRVVGHSLAQDVFAKELLL